jgi:hypothetical protein
LREKLNFLLRSCSKKRESTKLACGVLDEPGASELAPAAVSEAEQKLCEESKPAMKNGLKERSTKFFFLAVALSPSSHAIF